MMSKVFTTAALLMVAATVTLEACPACKDSFGANGANSSVGDAYSWSILFMLGVPLTILTVFTVVITRKIRQNPNSTQLM